MSLAGRLEDLAIADIFQILGAGRKNGTFLVSGSRGNAIIVFKNGHVVRAETDDLEKSLGEELLDAGLIKDTILNMALEVKKSLPSKSVAEILYDFGSVNSEALEKITRKRIEKVICSLLLWEDGDFRFELEDVDPEEVKDLPDKGWELSKGLSAEYLLMEGARVQDESSQLLYVPEESSVNDEEAGEEGRGWEENWEAPAVERRDISSLRSLTQELRFPNSASEITLLVLRFASDIFERGVLFMTGKEEMIGLGQFGLDVDRADEKVRRMVISIEKSPFFKKIIMQQEPFKGAFENDEMTRLLTDEFRGVLSSNCAIFPIVAEGRTVALLYCDNAVQGGKQYETEGLEIFISHAGLALEKSLLQRRLHELETGNCQHDGG